MEGGPRWTVTKVCWVLAVSGHPHSAPCLSQEVVILGAGEEAAGGRARTGGARSWGTRVMGLS